MKHGAIFSVWYHENIFRMELYRNALDTSKIRISFREVKDLLYRELYLKKFLS